MKVTIVSYNAVAAWKWNTSTEPHKIHKHAEPDEDDDDDDDVCGICQQAYESTCPECKIPGDDCPLSESLSPWAGCRADGAVWGECSHIFHMHCLLKWLETESSKQQCPMDRRPWGRPSSPATCAVSFGTMR